MKDFSEALRHVPHQPGVYQMFNAEGTIIYVGKAIDLNRRVRSYFTKSRKGKTAKVNAMVEHVDHFEYILVDNEVEALVLESNFIKEHAPYYNILLRDDKQYPYICITKEKFPRLLKVRQVRKDGADYFGPFPNAYAVNDIIRLLQRLFRLRTCRLDFAAGQRLDRPCLNYFIDQCPAPCVGRADEAAYKARMEEVRHFLKGEDAEIRAYLTREMESAAQTLQYERAARFRDDLRHLDELKERQKVTFTNQKDADVVAFARSQGLLMIQVFFVRDGKLVDRQSFEMQEAFEEEGPEILASFLKQFYLYAPYVPAEILLSEMPADAAAITAYLSEKRGRRVQLLLPKRGDKRALLRTAEANAQEALVKKRQALERKERHQDRGIRALEGLLGLPRVDRVEAYDISNLSGVQNVGSMVVFHREKKQPKEYRKFKIQTVDGVNEYASQREMLERRLDHGLRDRAEGQSQKTGFGAFPDLILMDGGAGQVHLAEDLLAQRKLTIPVVGLIKDDKHVTKALYYQDRQWLLDRRTPLYQYLYAVQEEVHRFAIHYHRKLRSQAMTHSILDEIQGIGPVRRRALLQTLGSIESIREAELEKLARVEGMNQRAAQAVWDYFHQKKEEDQKAEAGE